MEVQVLRIQAVVNQLKGHSADFYSVYSSQVLLRCMMLFVALTGLDTQRAAVCCIVGNVGLSVSEA